MTTGHHEFQLHSFSKPSIEQYRGLICDPIVTSHMPLAKNQYSDDWIQTWISAKESTWEEEGIGPWSIWLNGEFVGWAGLEPEGNYLGIGIVIHQEYWGHGKSIIRQILNKWGPRIEGRKVIVDFPESRRSELWASSFGLVKIGQFDLSGFTFHRYELPRKLFA